MHVSSRKLSNSDKRSEMSMDAKKEQNSSVLTRNAKLHTNSVSKEKPRLANLFARDNPEKNATTKSTDLAMKMHTKPALKSGKEPSVITELSLNALIKNALKSLNPTVLHVFHHASLRM
jgi:hypothetical protein